MSIELDLQIACDVQTLPHPAQFREWIATTLNHRLDTAELTIRVVDEEEIADLNYTYRKKLGPTNVLSFPYEPIPGIASNLLGDIVICAPLVEREAIAHNTMLLAHWAHLVIHGTLHLLGFDHQTVQDAEDMEGIETNIMIQLGFPPPYGDRIKHE